MLAMFPVRLSVLFLLSLGAPRVHASCNKNQNTSLSFPPLSIVEQLINVNEYHVTLLTCAKSLLSTNLRSVSLSLGHSLFNSYVFQHFQATPIPSENSHG